MSSILDTFVLRPARSATGNSPSTDEAVSGVDRDHINPAKMSALGYGIAPSRPVQPYADMYQAAVLQRPASREGSEEYIVWAATTSSFSVQETAAFVLTGDVNYVTPSAGTLTAGAFSDGTSTFFVKDASGRDLSSIESLLIVRGDTKVEVAAVFTQDASKGLVVLNAGTLTSLAGGFSLNRGDTISGVTYIIAAPKFWWSRNDQDVTRFGWDGKNQRWAPLKGSPPQNLGSVDPEVSSYNLSVPLTRFSIGDVLPGYALLPDEFALFRAGVSPDSIATPLEVLVVSDADASGAVYPVAGALYDAVVGVENGILLLNPTWTLANAGLSLWYNPESFFPDATGDLGSLGDLFSDSILSSPVLSPIPGTTDYPFVRLGFRTYLSAVTVKTDADLPLPSGVAEGTFVWSQSTGKIVLSDADIKKAQPGEAEYDIAYLEAHVFYDGVSMSTRPVTLRAASAALNDAGESLIGVDAGGSGIPLLSEIYLRRSEALPPPGASGVLHLPDQTGRIPNTGAVPKTRPSTSGLVRSVEGIGDTFFFTSSSAYPDLTVVEYSSKLPFRAFSVPRTEADVTKELSSTQPPGFTDVSRVQINRKPAGEALYFIQTQVTPSVYSEEARLLSRFMGPYTLVGDEVLRFLIDGTTYTWNASTTFSAGGSFSATSIAADIDSIISGSGRASVLRGRIVLSAGNLATGSVEIGWNADPDDLSGHAALGFLPSWRVDASGSTFRWQPDNGASVGLFRSPQNLDRSNSTPDVRAVGQFTGRVLTSNVPATPFFMINNPPLEDIAGYDEGSHFQTSLGLNLVKLKNYGVTQGIGVKYDWTEDRLIWTAQATMTNTPVMTTTYALQLENSGVLPETLSSAAMAPSGSGFGLYLRGTDGTPSAELTLGADFLLPGDGAAGQALLISREGGVTATGGGGEFTSGGDVFSNPVLSQDSAQNLILQQALFDAVEVGYLLQVLNGDALGVYEITGKALSMAGIAEISVFPDFPVTDANVSWHVYEAQDIDVYDPTVLADVQLVPFNHLASEPYQIRLLSSSGLVGGVCKAQVADAIRHKRDVKLRFGLTQPPLASEASVSYLVKGQSFGLGELGVIRETGMLIPDLTDAHFTESTSLASYFQIRVGPSVFSLSLANLNVVTVFSVLVPPGVIEVGQFGTGIVGQVKFADDILLDLAENFVYYDQLFLSPLLLAAGESEIDPTDGLINLSSDDALTFVGETCYFVEQMITEKSEDVTLSPLNGAIFFNRPLREGQIVEAEYKQADSSGQVKLDSTGAEITVVEFLPIIVRLEVATLVSDTSYSFNPQGKTVSSAIDPYIWVDAELQNYAGTVSATVDNTTSLIAFASPVDAASTVKINYGVLEAFGGEQAYNVSTIPVYRPPLFLLAGEDRFYLETDRTGDIYRGQLMMIGASPFYVVTSTYDAGDDETLAVIWPPREFEVGSRAPGKDSLMGLSDVPVAVTVDPAGWNLPGGGAEGFLLLTAATLLPVDKGSVEFIFVGDLRKYTKARHLLEINGYPHVIVGASLSEDGQYTTVSTSTPALTGFGTGSVIRISVRPVYGARPTEFEGISGFLESEGNQVILLGSIDPGTGLVVPGRVLVEGVHYTVDSGTGALTLTPPAQGPLLPGERLVIQNTSLREIQPLTIEGAVIAPIYQARYLHATLPSAGNRILGATLSAKYTFRSPDTFYVEVLPASEYLSEVSEVAIAKVSSGSRTGGFLEAFPSSIDPSTQGTLGLRGQVRNLKDQDRAGRAYVSLFNDLIVGFEQVQEAISGGAVGDRDGKFRFFVGRDRVYAPPGYEDLITGDMNPRLVWGEVFQAANGTFGVTEQDPIVDPETAVQDALTLEVSGDTMNPWLLSFYLREQKSYCLNEMDDVILRGKERTTFKFPFSFVVTGDFKEMWYPSTLSRLYPESTLAFTMTYPGIDAGVLPSDPGVYSFAKIVAAPSLLQDGGSIIASTFGTDIGVISNPALGPITGITGQTRVRERLARAHVWAYSATGFPELDAASDGLPSVIATILPLGEFPLSSETGLPDLAQLTAQGGALPDISTGDVDLSTPRWGEPYGSASAVGYDAAKDIYPQVSLGTPDGAMYQLGLGSGFLSGAAGLIFPSQAYKGVFVSKVLSGCIITFTDGTNDITNPDDIIRVTERGGTLPFAPVRGDTIFVVTPQAVDASAFSDPPTTAEMKKFAKNQPFLDVGVRERSGSFVDHSLPSAMDPSFPIKELVNQKAATPLMCIEAPVEFVNVATSPHKFPALLGLDTNDSGDHTLPYMLDRNTELNALGAVAGAFNAVVMSDNGTVTFAVYPDEILGTDGSVTGAAVGTVPPAALLSSSDFLPVTTAGAYTPRSGIADVRPFDLLLVEVGQAGISPGATGILSVGRVTADYVEPPRFVTPTLLGTRLRYAFENVMVHVGAGSGMIVTQVGPDTLLDISSVVAPYLNDGTPGLVGGLNLLVGAPYPGNLITIRLYDQGTGALVETIVYDGTAGTIDGGAGPAVATAAPTFDQKLMTVPVLGFAANLGVTYDFTISVDTYNGGSATAGSTTAFIGTDRLTFTENLDLTTVKPRLYTTAAPGLVSVASSLRVRFVEASGVETCSVNDQATVNGGAPFTFLARNSALPSDVGTFAAGTGTVRVMGFEGGSNTPILTTAPITFAAVPSADQGEDAVIDILTGTSSIEDGTTQLRSVVAGAGSLDAVTKGDVVVISESSVGDAAIKAGTYIVRHSIPVENPVYALPDTQERSLTVGAGSSTGWAPTPFPTVSSASSAPFRIIVSGHLTIPSSPSGHNFPSSGTLYVILDRTNPSACLAVDYGTTTVVGDLLHFNLTAATGRYGDGTLIPVDADLIALVADGSAVSGMTYVEVQNLSQQAQNNVVGFDDAGVTAWAGFAAITLTGLAGASWTAAGGDLVLSTGAVPAAGEIGVWVSDAPGGTYTEDSADFYPDEDALVYEGVPFLMDLTQITQAQWDTIHGTVLTEMQCLLPGETLATLDSIGQPGFLAVSGVFLEPSTPLPVSPLNGADPLVVDLTHSLTAGAVGMRDAASFGGASPEAVSFSVKRIRRFHEVLDGISENLTPLRFAYEIRSGTVTAYAAVTRIVIAAGGTQLGFFDNVDVNIHAGDTLRIFDVPGGTLLDSAEIASVTGPTTLKLRAPGFSSYTPVGGETFQVYLRQAPVPHAQSNDQLLELSTDQVILSSVRDPLTNDGGRVLSTNKLRDSSVPDFTDPALGIVAGDIILVDPAGSLTGPSGAAVVPETGMRPVGDQSVSDRADGSHLGGGPSELDDNRGWYRIVSLTSTEITVSPVTEFSGNSGSPVVFGASLQEYAVLPEITNSGTPGPNPGGDEGQMDLRVTAVAGTDSLDPNSYAGNSFSVEPFSYKIIRPTTLLSEESIDLVMLMRERMLSWMEEIALPSQGTKSGSYFVFQRDEHVSDLGSSTDPSSGLGVPSNVFVTSISGLTQYAPFANTSDCLSVLDRRYWCLDMRLDKEEPPFSVAGNPYSSFEEDNSVMGYSLGSGRPVEPDLIEGVLDRTDTLRDQRYSWISFRADRINGSLLEASRAEELLPRELKKARALAAQRKALGKL